jgi:hypothetical protein
VGTPFVSESAAHAWLASAGDDQLAVDLAVLNRALHAYRLASSDPYLGPISSGHALVARVGFGAGEQVAEGLWTEARELIAREPRARRPRLAGAHARLADMLTGRRRALTCEELALRARLDLDQGRHREAALQLLIALDAALAELPNDAAAPALAGRLRELGRQRDAVARAAQAALAGQLTGDQRQGVALTLGQIESALRARAVLRP